jgi:hypothetical protein
MRKLLILAAVAAFAFTSAADAASQCKDPKTGKFIKCPAAAAAPAKPASKPASTTTATSASTTSGAKSAATTGATPKHCTKGKPCGNTCIKSTDVCHKT